MFVMRIVIASPYLPWPLEYGGNAAQFSTLRCLAADHEFTLVCPVYERSKIEHAQKLAARLPEVQIRAVPCWIPHSILWRAAKQILGWVRRQVERRNRVCEGIRALPFNPFVLLPAPYVSALAQTVMDGAELVQAEFAEMMPLGAWFPHNIPRVFVHHQLHFVYTRRFIEVYGTNEVARYLESCMHCQEIAYLREYDTVITFSEVDRSLLRSELGSVDIQVSPFPIPHDVGLSREPALAWNQTFLFVGPQGNPPNRDALEWLLTALWPRIHRAVPEATLKVVGKWDRKWQERIKASPKATCTGFVPDLAQVVRGSIQLVPLRIGSGIRTKLLTAMAQGTPSVATAVAAEGLLGTDSGGIILADADDAFVDAAVRLARSPSLWAWHAAAGLAAVARFYSPEAVRSRRNKIYERLAETYRNRRG